MVMKLAGRYFILKYKCCMKALAKSAVFTVLVFSLLLVGVLVVSFSIQQNQILPKIKIGVVIPESEGIIKKAVQFASSMDSVENTCEFYYLEESEARKGLETGDLQVVVILPVNFYQDVYQGINTPAEVLMLEDDKVNSEVFKELLTAALAYLQISEAGVYAMLDAAGEEVTRMKYSGIGDYIAENYVVTLFDRMDIYEEKVISPIGKLEYSQYMTVTFMMIVLLIMGSNFSCLYQKSEQIVEQKLKTEGINIVTFSIVKTIIIASCLWFVWLLCYGGICCLSKYLDWNVVWWNWNVLLYGFLLCSCMAGFFHFIYELSQNGAFGALLLLFINIGMVLCSGIMIPRAYFSEIVQKIGSYLPVTFWSDFIQNVLYDTIDSKQIGILMGIIFMEISAGAVIVWKKL